MEKRIYLETLKLCLISILTQKYIVCVQYVISTHYIYIYMCVFNMQFRHNIKMYNIYWLKIGWSK